jgi:hypothetical protein
VSDDQPTAQFRKLPYPSAQDAAQNSPSEEPPETGSPDAAPADQAPPRGWRARRRAGRENGPAPDEDVGAVAPVGPAHDDTPAEPARAGSAEEPAVGDPESGFGVPEPLASSTRALRRQRRRLVQKRDEMIFHLGGLTYDLHLEGELHAPVAEHRAGLIYELDTTLEAIDAQLAAKGNAHNDVTPLPIVVGSCRTCRTRFLANARYCMTCGAVLAPPEPGSPEFSSTAPKATA